MLEEAQQATLIDLLLIEHLIRIFKVLCGEHRRQNDLDASFVRVRGRPVNLDRRDQPQRDQGIGPFRRTKIWQCKNMVHTDYGRHGHVGEIMSFGYQLRAQQELCLSRSKALRSGGEHLW